MENIFKGCMPALMTPCNQDLSPNFDLLVKKLLDKKFQLLAWLEINKLQQLDKLVLKKVQ